MIRKHTIKAVLVLTSLFFAGAVKSQTEPVLDSVLTGINGKLVAGAQAYVKDTVFFDAGLKPGILSTNKVSNIVSFRINEFSNRLLPDSFKVDASVRVIYTNSSNVKDSVTKTLSVSYNKSKPYTSRAHFYFNDAYEVNVRVLSLTAQYAILDTVVKVLELENEMILDRDYKLDCSEHSIHTISQDTGGIDTSGELTVSWPLVPVAEEYDLEWTYIDKSAIESGRYNVDGDLNADLLFKFNATRVTITGTQYNIPLLYDGDGKLYFRVRGAQTHADGRRVTTPWSSDFISDGGLGDYDFTGHERKLNWQSNTSFAEEGKRKSVVQYFDGSLKGRQTVTKDNSTGTTVVAETLYDKQGRPVIQIMPAPTLSSIIAFTPRFNAGMDGMNSVEYDKGLYDTLHSDADYCSVSAPQMDTTKGVSLYYSGVNPQSSQAYHQYIPNAYGFAFTETKYEQDNTGRISAQGGVGQQYRLGSGRETRYYYGEPDQEELDALFGTEAGDYSHYQKNMVRDANKQYSVSYVDMHGRTVATALAGASPDSLQALASNSSGSLTTSLLNPTNNLIKGTAIESVKGLIVTAHGPHIFNYELNPESLGLANCADETICYDCLYDLEITVSDDCNNQTMPGGVAYKATRKNFSLGSIDKTCTPAEAFSLDFTLELEEGSYTITKRLSINEEAMRYYRDSVYMVQNTCKTYDDIVNEQRTIIQEQLGDCAPDTLNEPDYLSYRRQMLADVTPVSGQYANPDTKDRGFSIFNEMSNVARYKQVGGYKDGDGNDAFVSIDGAVPVSPSALNESDFISNFENSWADALLTIHPEYPLLLDYEKLSASHIWDEDFEKTDTYADALTKGYLNPTASANQPAAKFGTSSRDPLFTSLKSQFSAGDSIAAMQSLNDSLFNFTKRSDNGIYNLWSVATMMVKCPSGNDPISSDCAATWSTNANAFGSGLCEGELNMAWRLFRLSYQRLKQNWIADFIWGRNSTAYPDTPYIAVFARSKELFHQIGIDNLYDSSVYRPKVQGGVDVMVDSSCHQYAQRWVAQLASCNYPEDSLKNIIIPRLVQVCKEGGDASHLLGASTVKPGSTYTYSSFEDVINQYNLAHGITTNTACNAWLIDMPKPYDQPTFVTNMPTYQKPDSCSCARISLLYSQYSENSGSYSSFSNYMLVKYKTTIAEGALDTLLNLCNGTITCRYIPQMINIPPALQCGVGETCAECGSVKQLYADFLDKFPGTVPTLAQETEHQDSVNRLFATYMNQKLGFSKSSAEYITFMDSCTESKSADCDSLQAIKDEYRKILVEVRKGTAANGYRLTPVKDEIIDGINGLLEWNHRAINGRQVSSRYKVVPVSYLRNNKFYSIAWSGQSGSDSAFNITLPVNLDYSPFNVSGGPVAVAALNAAMPGFRAGMVVRDTDFVGTLRQGDLEKKYYGTGLRDEWGRFRFMWAADSAWYGTGACLPHLGLYYGYNTPPSKYLLSLCTQLNSGYYTIAFYKMPQATPDYSQYNTYRTDLLTAVHAPTAHSEWDERIPINAFKDSLKLSDRIYHTADIKKVLSFYIDSSLLKLYNPATNHFGDTANTRFIRAKMEMMNGDTVSAYVFDQAPFVYKQKVDTVIYGADCQKGFTAYYNSRKGTHYTFAQLDSLSLAQCGESLDVCDTTIHCTTIKDDLRSYYYKYVKPAAGYVDLPMRTFAGNITPEQGPKGVFDINGNLIGNTIDSTLAAVNASFATIWNSSPIDSAIGTLSSLPNGLFRLTLRPGQKMHSTGVTGMRYYQFDATGAQMGKYSGAGTGSYVDFGDGTHTVVNDIEFNDITQIHRAYGIGTPDDYIESERVFYYYTVHHNFQQGGTSTVTMYHSDIQGVVQFDCDSGSHVVGNIFSNIRGYFPQQLNKLVFHATTDSSLHDFSRIKNFNQINDIEHINFQAHGTPAGGVAKMEFPSMAANHDMKTLWLEMDQLTPPAQQRGADQWLPDLNINFPKLGSVYLFPYDSALTGKMNFCLPHMRALGIRSGFTNGGTNGVYKITTAQIDTMINQVARTSQVSNGSLYFNISDGTVRSSASDAAVALLASKGWSMTGAGLSNTGSFITVAHVQPTQTDTLPLYNDFTDYFNGQHGTNYTFQDIKKIYSDSCGQTLDLDNLSFTSDDGSLLCGKEPMDIAATLYQPDACSDSTLLIATTATEIYKAYRDSLLGAFNEAYTSKCLNAGAIESFTLNRPVSEYHYTLYYYDQAGNLIKTISPEGVHPNRDDTWLAEIKTKRAAGEAQTPDHTLPVMYRYNSLNQVVTQNSPDGGYSYFFYDRLGRLVVSQNAKQKAADNYSYTRYDYLGRITEVGEKSQSTVMTNTTSRSQSLLATWLNYTYTLNSQTVLARQVTRTVYDLPATLPLVEGTTAYSFHQKSYTMRNRVSNTLLYDVLLPGSPDPVYSDYASGSFYSYDIHGNVDTLLQDYRTGLMATGNGKNRFKLTAYNYDLVSGKVNQVHFQPGEKDQFYHRYEYDAENRITGVFTTDVKEFVGTGNNEDHEASYEYYKHGPLARTVLGQQQVQGIDYAYTLQGWLKGVNSTSLMPDRDMGGDDGSFIARDVYGFNLNYFRGDYNPINHEREAFPDHTTYMAAHTVNSLYNGNISSMAVNISKFAPQLYNYKYDQLNRIVSMDVYRGLNQTQNKWNSLALTTNYKERVSYDPNGNILTYERNGTTAGGQPLTMDKLTYNYFTDGTNKRNNRLRMVRDDVASTNYTEDIDDQLGAVNNEADSNYVYDEIGNLIQDKSEKITGITWNVYGKILEISKTATDQNPVTKISYTYDAAGNRISKKTEKGEASSETTWYVRDAQGNVLGVYTDANTLTLTEHHLYGSSRLGIVNRDIVVSDPTITGTSLNLLGTSYLANFERGKKFFELTNHLGNVLVTISDRKLQLTETNTGQENNGGCEIGTGVDVLDVATRNGESNYTAITTVNLLPGFESNTGDDYSAYVDNSLTTCVPLTPPTVPTQGWYYAADVVGANDYYPFGMLMPGRKFSSGSYRYGFNGQERSTELNDNSYTAEYWQYDGRLGKRCNVDPVLKPNESTYATFANSPIWLRDPNGADTIRFTSSTTLYPRLKVSDGYYVGGGSSMTSGITVIQAPGEDVFFYDQVLINASAHSNNPTVSATSREFFPNNAASARKYTGITKTDMGLAGEVNDNDFRSLAKLASTDLIKYLEIHDPIKYKGLSTANAYVALENGVRNAQQSIATVALLFEGGIALSKGISLSRFGSLTSSETRIWYNEMLSKLDIKVASTEGNARFISLQRNAIKAEGRFLMKDRQAAAALDISDPIRPVEYYIEKYKAQGYQGESLWKKIIESGKKPNAEVNKKFGIK